MVRLRTELLVSVHCEDPYLARGLESALADHGLTVLPAGDDDIPGALDGMIDDGGALVVALVEHGVAPPADVPLVVLVEDRAAAHRALDAGARGVVKRGLDPHLLAAALESAAHGFLVVDPRLELVLAAQREPDVPERMERGPLTEREHEVMALLAQGLTNKEIAAMLGVSAHTAKFHVNGILEKLGAMTRTEAVAIAVRSGLLHL